MDQNVNPVPTYDAQPLPPMAEPPKKNSKTWLIILIVVLVLCCCCLIGFGIFAYNYGDQFMNAFGNMSTSSY
jgi:hypothetical protein